MTATAPKSLGFECKHVHYVTAPEGSDEMLAIKEYEHFDDGTTRPNLRLVKNHERHFYITRPNFRNHQEKKEWEDMNRLQRFTCTQAKMPNTIRRALGMPPREDSRMNMICRSPYIYGSDVSSATLVKHHYMEKWPDRISINSMAAIDSETSMVTEEIIMLSVTFRERIRLIVVRDFVKNLPDPEAAIRAAAELYIGDILRSRNATIQIEFVNNAGECAKRSIETAHEWKPDFLAAWNMDFDIPKIIEALIKYGYDPNQIFCDPAVPPQFRRVTREGTIPRNFTSIKEDIRNPADFLRQFGYRQGKKQKETASGKVTPLAPAEQWHQLDQPASWYMIDPMCVYLRLRIAFGKDQSYALDAILNKHKIKQKLKFEAADHVTGGAWHMFMQENYPAEYCVYNIYDSIAMELLDEKTTDIGRQISSLCGHSEYHRFPSQPRRLCDDLHFFGLARNRVIGSTSDSMEIELDDLVIGLTDHIVTLPSFAVAENGMTCVEETPNDATMVFVHVADLDVEGTYPNEEILCNISRETTMMEMADIQGVTEAERRAVGVNLSGGHVNAAEICHTLYKAPTMIELLALLEADSPQVVEQVEAGVAA